MLVIISYQFQLATCLKIAISFVFKQIGTSSVQLFSLFEFHAFGRRFDKFTRQKLTNVHEEFDYVVNMLQY